MSKNSMLLLVCCVVSFCMSNTGFSQNKQTSAESRSIKELTETVNRLVASNMDLNFNNLATSVKVLAEEYVRLHKITPPITKVNQHQWLTHSKSKGETTNFYPFNKNSEPAYQAPYPAYVFYRGKNFTREIWRELNTFTHLAPLFMITYRSFNDSWVYLTTVNDTFLIYPYLTLKEAVNNRLPTKQIFYTAADFKNRTYGWTPPYLDLAGAGMMVTVAYPIYDKNMLLGVMSRDITLGQLTKKILKPIRESTNTLFCLIVDKNGLAIANSLVTATKEIQETGKKAGAPVIYYRNPKGLSSVKLSKVQSSSNTLFNESVESILTSVRKNPFAKMWQYKLQLNKKSYNITAQKMESTGWLVITIFSD